MKNLAQNNENVNTASLFDMAKRAFEKAYASGADYSAELENLATAIARSVLNKVIDPQRKTAAEKSTVSNSGINRALDELKRGMYFDGENLKNIRHWSNMDSVASYDSNGDMRLDHDKDADNGIAALIDYSITDGYDLVQAAVVALLEMAADHAANGGEWLDAPFTVSRLSKRVYIRETDSRAYKDVETTPIQECYRAVRRAVASSRAVQTDPRSAYTYISIDAYEPEQLEQIFVRAGKWEDIGSIDCHGLYTGNIETFRANRRAEELIEKMNLTARQLQVLKLRMRGYGIQAIATYLGTSRGNIQQIIGRIRREFEELEG